MSSRVSAGANLQAFGRASGLALLLIAVGFDLIHYAIFRDSDYIFKFIPAVNRIIFMRWIITRK